MLVAALQMVSKTSVHANLLDADALLQQAAAQGAQLAVLPEYFCLLGHKDTDKLGVQESVGEGLIQAFLCSAAKRYGMWIVGGTLPMSTDNPKRVRNTCLVFDPDGNQCARYDKMHLFAFNNGAEHYDESRVLESGTEPVTFSMTSRSGQVWRIGLSVCYDLRFPELYRALAADVLLVPSAFTYTTGQAHWELLLRARAVENLAYVVAPAQGGLHENGRRTWGHSMVVDAWGQVLSCCPDGSGVVLAELDYAALVQHRKQLPALSHRVLKG